VKIKRCPNNNVRPVNEISDANPKFEAAGTDRLHNFANPHRAVCKHLATHSQAWLKFPDETATHSAAVGMDGGAIWVSACPRDRKKTPNMNSHMQPWNSMSGSVHVGVLVDGWNLAEPPADGAEEPRVFRYTVLFDTPFSAAPVVHAALTGFDFDQRDSSRLSLRVTGIHASGFTAEIATWRDTRVYSVEFSWLAVGA
jgi:H-type lectin domain